MSWDISCFEFCPRGYFQAWKHCTLPHTSIIVIWHQKSSNERRYNIRAINEANGERTIIWHLFCVTSIFSFHSFSLLFFTFPNVNKHMTDPPHSMRGPVGVYMSTIPWELKVANIFLHFSGGENMCEICSLEPLGLKTTDCGNAEAAKEEALWTE